MKLHQSLSIVLLSLSAALALTACAADPSEGAASDDGTAANDEATAANDEETVASEGDALSDAQGPTECVMKINALRKTKGLKPLIQYTAKQPCVSGQSKTDALSSTPHKAFTACQEWAQNECPGWSGTYSSIINGCFNQMWAEGPGTGTAHGHYNTMTSTKYTKVACGFYRLPNGKVWATQDFYP